MDRRVLTSPCRCDGEVSTGGKDKFFGANDSCCANETLDFFLSTTTSLKPGDWRNQRRTCNGENGCGKETLKFFLSTLETKRKDGITSSTHYTNGSTDQRLASH
ncbi:Hypothetical predicted protein [Olea europaea subsp. europaea]|uniref:Uncharacterized protein n=1 Tax=Olea europaea subsp. europaea TaxID=158383 RepID=A0A8S0PN51_OLEEU|nr:Hypothetical predicted protein [Olea europaea subsp. europaea]